MVAVNETSGAAVAGGSPNSKEASPTKVEEQRQEYIVLKQKTSVLQILIAIAEKIQG